MSTDNEEDDAVAAELLPEPPPDPDSIRWLFFDPAVRNYVFAGLGALAMVFVILFALSGPIGGVMVVLLGVAGMLRRWPASPGFVLLLVLWFVLFPGGIPPGFDSPFEVVEGRFRVADLMLAFSLTVYVACHYRLYGLSAQALPFENTVRKKGEKPYRRPPEVIRPGEITRLLVVAGVVVIAGQVAWLIVTGLAVDPGEFIPLQLADDPRTFRRGVPSEAMSTGFSRFVILTGLLFFTTLFARLVFGYWRLRMMGPAEAGMMLQDAGWDETRRENTRLEVWRAWAKKQAEARAKAAAKQAAKAGQSGGPGRREG
jgi:hypothetical protein